MDASAVLLLFNTTRIIRAPKHRGRYRNGRSGAADKACYYTGLCVLRSANWPLMKVKFLLDC